MSFEPIENYGVIGNMRSIAHVGVNGSIDFLCYPNFDSPTVFPALIDDERGGCFQIQPQLKQKRIRQLYLPDTNILLTRFLADDVVAELTDYMPIGTDGEQPNEIIRTLTVIRGEVDFNMQCRPRFDYSRCGHAVNTAERCAIFSPASGTCPPMALYSDIPLQQHSEDVASEFTLRAGEKVTFIFGGGTHFMEVLTIWIPMYVLSGGVEGSDRFSVMADPSLRASCGRKGFSY
jgi:GH15 family glucan-1,4-alpha-glucosidase